MGAAGKITGDISELKNLLGLRPDDFHVGSRAIFVSPLPGEFNQKILQAQVLQQSSMYSWKERRTIGIGILARS
jgi:hypothetical protein